MQLIALREISVVLLGLGTGLGSGGENNLAGKAACGVWGPFLSPKEYVKFC